MQESSLTLGKGSQIRGAPKPQEAKEVNSKPKDTQQNPKKDKIGSRKNL